MCGPCKRIRFSKPDLRDRLADSTKERWYNNIVLNIPHASVGGLGIARWDNKVALLSEVKRWTDWYTDLLFIPDNREGIQFITSDYSRFVVDVERLVNDPLEKIGQGIVYKMYNGLHRTFKGNEEIEMFRYHANYIRDLRLMLNEHSLLIDCHSFPSDLSDVDICIGYNEDWSRPTDFVIELCKSVFEKHGYKVGINTPYANAIAPETGYTYNSIMIEVNKRLYLNEQTLEMTEEFIKLHKCLETLYGLLKNLVWNKTSLYYKKGNRLRTKRLTLQSLHPVGQENIAERCSFFKIYIHLAYSTVLFCFIARMACAVFCRPMATSFSDLSKSKVP